MPIPAFPSPFPIPPIPPFPVPWVFMVSLLSPNVDVWRRRQQGQRRGPATSPSSSDREARPGREAQAEGARAVPLQLQQPPMPEGRPAEEEQPSPSRHPPCAEGQENLGVARLGVLQGSWEQDHWREQQMKDRMAAMKDQLKHLADSVTAIMDHLGLPQPPPPPAPPHP